MNRVSLHKAYYQGLGSSLSGSNELIDQQFFDAVTETDFEAHELGWKSNSSRVLENAKAKRGR